MPRTTSHPCTRRHILIRDDDWAYLMACFGPDSTSRAGVSDAVRQLVHTAVARMQARVEAKLDAGGQG